VGSVFSPYYARARRNNQLANPEDFCALNVALYSTDHKRWTMTERGARHCERSVNRFKIGPSQLHWDGQVLRIDIDEVSVPLPRRVRGHITLRPNQLFEFSAPLDADGRHRWGPLAPDARVSVHLGQPEQNWEGHAYLDSNEGDEPIDTPFVEWDWSRSVLSDGSVAVIYDVQPKIGNDHVLALRFSGDGHIEQFLAPPRVQLAKTVWRIPRRMRSDGPVTISKQLEDTPFYQRAMLNSELLGEKVTSFHESLNLPRLVSPVVQAMLPWRMPRQR
jgi:carotenoid 1,2-hydratase